MNARALLVWLLVLSGGTGCVTAYQPLVGLQRPFAIDTEVANFEGQRILVRCVPTAHVPASQAERLCRQMRALFTNQGATVETEVPKKNAGVASGAGFGGEGPFKPDLIVELRGRLLKEDSNIGLWVLCVATLTLVPGITEYEFAQDVTIRDATGFLLSSDSLQGRFERSFGLAVWAGSALTDLGRPAEDKVTGNRWQQEFSSDFFGQVSQLAFQARMRAAVMRQLEPGAPR